MLRKGLPVTTLLSLWPKGSRAGRLYAVFSDIARRTSSQTRSGSENKANFPFLSD